MSEFRIASSGNTLGDTRAAIETAFDSVHAELGGEPSFVLAAASVDHDLEALIRALEARAGVAVHGFTSCQGCMTSEGVHDGGAPGLGVWAVRDAAGSYGTALVSEGGDAREAGRVAIKKALEQAGRPGEVPSLILLNPTPRNEEKVLEGIQDEIGTGVPILGGSAADNDVSGRWALFSGSQVETAGVMVSVLFPSVPLAFSFRSGYSPTGSQGVVTRAVGRTLIEIDGEPAAKVYNRWTGGLLDSLPKEGGNVLALSSLQPLGRVVGMAEGIPEYSLSHPEAVLADGSLCLFTNIEEGDVVHAMTGSHRSLITRGGAVIGSALHSGSFDGSHISGALVTYCAGCMLTLDDEIEKVWEEIRTVMPGTPFLASFTFGEQGCFLGGANLHANLMISAIVFGR